MKLLKQTEEYRADTEEEAKEIMEKFRQDAHDKGYTLGASGYKYKTKKAKGEIVDECFLTTVVKVIGGPWDE